MTWLQRYRLKHYMRNSIILLPVTGIVTAVIIASLLNAFEEKMALTSSISPEAARIVIGMLAAAMLTFIVFLSSTLLLAVQLASAQLTARVIAFLFSDPVTKGSLTTFVFTFTFSLAVLIRIDQSVPLIAPRLAAWSCVLSLCVFFYLLDHVGKELRPSGMLKRIGSAGNEVIESVYPRRLSGPSQTSPTGFDFIEQSPTLTIANPKPGVVLAFNAEGLASLGTKAGCLIELVPEVGDFVAAGDPLFRVFHNTATVGSSTLDPQAANHCVAVGQERTPEQDPTLAFRIIVDIAAKALSPAVNDPTTAVLAIDQIHHLLRSVGRRHLDEGVIRDDTGHLRLVYRTPDWEDFVQLAVTEIRQFGCSSIQIVRRLRAMLENLLETLPEQRAELIRKELEVLSRVAERSFFDAEDLKLASTGDSKGMGGTKEWSQKAKKLADGQPLRASIGGQPFAK